MPDAALPYSSTPAAEPFDEFIPVCRPDIGEDEINEVVETLRSGWLATGRRTARFEDDFRTYAGARHALATSSCTAALHLALEGLGVGPGDEVVTSPLTFCATVNSILHVGAEPVLADIDPDGNLDPAAVAAALTPRTRAVLPVHLAGLPCAMEPLWRLAAEHGLLLIEDAAHAVGARFQGRPIGALDGRAAESDAVAFSFYAGKNMTTGEGGMLTTADDALAERIRSLRLHGITKDAWARYSADGAWSYEVLEPGFKYNLSDLQSAIGLHQLRKLDANNRRRRALAARYNEAFADVEEVAAPVERDDRLHAWHLYVLTLRLDRLRIDRAEFIRRLRAYNIGASVHFIPIPLHRAYRGRAGLAPERCPRALALYPRLVSLPLYPSMTFEQVDAVVGAVKRIAREARTKEVA